MRINFKDFDDRSLCNKCEHGRVIKTADGKRSVYCDAIMKYVPPNIMECSDYQAKGTLSKWDMEKTAWTLETKNGQVVGFKRPERKEHDSCE